MTHTRRWVLAALTAGLCLLTACNRNHRNIIAVIPKGNADIYWQTVHAGAVKASREANVEIVWDGAPNETDISTELQIMDTMINRHVNAIALAPSDREALASAVNRASNAGIPVVIYDSAVATNQYVSFISTDNFAAGEMAGERMGKILNGKGDIVVVKTNPGGASTTAREDGFRKVITEKFPGIHILDERYGNAMVATSLDVTENMLTAHPNISGIFASNESGTNGAMQALRSRHTKVKLVGFDWSPTTLAGIKSGMIDSLVIQNPFQMGYEAVMTCVKAIRREPVQKQVNMPPRLITKENLDDPDVQAQVNPDLSKYLGK
ncbi:MAG TPA: substrate-binding domain-containing protein [Bryobacteraceae bacterium]|nr:substrate-binding domain-containing protein [Bryobacteraceae bacterium]